MFTRCRFLYLLVTSIPLSRRAIVSFFNLYSFLPSDLQRKTTTYFQSRRSYLNTYKLYTYSSIYGFISLQTCHLYSIVCMCITYDSRGIFIVASPLLVQVVELESKIYDKRLFSFVPRDFFIDYLIFQFRSRLFYVLLGPPRRSQSFFSHNFFVFFLFFFFPTPVQFSDVLHWVFSRVTGSS